MEIIIDTGDELGDSLSVITTAIIQAFDESDLCDADANFVLFAASKYFAGRNDVAIEAERENEA